MTATIVYKGDLRTEATHTLSGQSITTDAPPDNQGKGEAFSPTDLCATSLGACLLTIMGIKARDSGINIQGASILLTKIMTQEPPRRIERIEMELSMPPLPYSIAEKKLLTEAVSSCPVCRSLSENLQTNLSIKWNS